MELFKSLAEMVLGEIALGETALGEIAVRRSVATPIYELQIQVIKLYGVYIL